MASYKIRVKTWNNKRLIKEIETLNCTIYKMNSLGANDARRLALCCEEATSRNLNFRTGDFY